MKALPTGTVTFIFTDIEGSTRLIQRLGAGHREVLETHTHLLRKAISEAGGIEVGERGDGFFFVFVSACDAVKAAAQIQRSLAEHSWPAEGTVRVRIGMHTGEWIVPNIAFLLKRRWVSHFTRHNTGPCVDVYPSS